MTITPGKLAGMMAVADGRGVIAAAAMDQRGSLQKALAKEKGVLTLMGNQGATMQGTRILREWIESGMIGDVTEVHYWTNRPIWPQGKGLQFPAKPVPADIEPSVRPWMARPPMAAFSGSDSNHSSEISTADIDMLRMTRNMS